MHSWKTYQWLGEVVVKDSCQFDEGLIESSRPTYIRWSYINTYIHTYRNGNGWGEERFLFFRVLPGTDPLPSICRVQSNQFLFYFKHLDPLSQLRGVIKRTGYIFHSNKHSFKHEHEHWIISLLSDLKTDIDSW